MNLRTSRPSSAGIPLDEDRPGSVHDRATPKDRHQLEGLRDRVGGMVAGMERANRGGHTTVSGAQNSLNFASNSGGNAEFERDRQSVPSSDRQRFGQDGSYGVRAQTFEQFDSGSLGAESSWRPGWSGTDFVFNRPGVGLAQRQLGASTQYDGSGRFRLPDHPDLARSTGNLHGRGRRIVTWEPTTSSGGGFPLEGREDPRPGLSSPKDQGNPGTKRLFPVKLTSFDGSQSLETFLAKFENAARYWRWWLAFLHRL